MTELERGAHANTLPLAGPALTRLVRRSESSSHQDRQLVPNGYSACLTVIMIACETGSAVGVTPSLKTPVLAGCAGETLRATRESADVCPRLTSRARLDQ